MAKETSLLLPMVAALLNKFGERIRLARLRRRLLAKQVAERAGISLSTLRSLERGNARVSLGAYAVVMQVLGIEEDLNLLGKADPLGRALQDARLPARRQRFSTIRGRTLSAHASGIDKMKQIGEAARIVEHLQRPYEEITKSTFDPEDWIVQGGYTSSRELAKLIDLVAPVTSKEKK